MAPFDTSHTADYSPLVVHFTKPHRMVMHDLIDQEDPLFALREASAMERLVNMLTTREVLASPMPWLPRPCCAVCFTECIWDSLTRLAEHYSSYGIVFSKRLVFDAGGGPALYLRGDLLSALGNEIPEDLHPFIAPFDPDATLKDGVRLDWLQEREWRLPSSLRFEYSDIEHILVESIQDATDVVRELGARQLPESKVIPMEVYRNIIVSWRDR